MILIVNVCLDRLNELEFVEPISKILEKVNNAFQVKHYSKVDSNELISVDKIIICGTSLKDFEYLHYIDAFNYLNGLGKPVLGICAGMQIIAKTFGCELLDRKIIGQHVVKIEKQNPLTSIGEFYSYFLVSKIVKVNSSFDVIATTGCIASIIKQKGQEIYGCLFHPEVLNAELILNFCRIV
jgi:GMP synthase (glutamine-hydrolysing)